VVVIRGSGVDVERFAPAPAPAPPAGDGVVAMLAGRMLWTKGVAEAVAAARMLKERGANVRVALVGEPDDENPESIPRSQLQRWVDDGVVEWRGHIDDMPAAWRSAHIGLLPSYREGLPKTLLEAAACGLPLVATDVPGCREVVAHDDNGLLVAARAAAPLADALESLAGDAAARSRMGRRSRERAEREFAESIVVAATLDLYRDLAGRKNG
jgi:glycosyltransferase involved in cell wall biosynthesis